MNEPETERPDGFTDRVIGAFSDIVSVASGGGSVCHLVAHRPDDLSLQTAVYVAVGYGNREPLTVEELHALIILFAVWVRDAPKVVQ